MRLNIGCGEFPAKSWLNVDLTHDSADLKHDVTTGLPAVGEPITRIYAGHVLEHLPYEDLPRILAAWRESADIYAETRLAVVGPECDWAEQMIARAQLPADAYGPIRYGGGRWTGDVHLWRSTEGATAEVLRQAGWRPEVTDTITLSCQGWPITAHVNWQFALLAAPAV